MDSLIPPMTACLNLCVDEFVINKETMEPLKTKATYYHQLFMRTEESTVSVPIFILRAANVVDIIYTIFYGFLHISK